MRVRALDVMSARIDGQPIPMGSCTLAARTEPDGRHGWEASGWLRYLDPTLAACAQVGNPVPVSLETSDGTLNGSAFISLGRAAGTHDSGAPVFLVGVGHLDPWPG
jgi:hypothetical protein